MSEWSILLVKDLIELGVIEKPLDGNHGGTHPKGDDFIDSGIPFIMASDINNNKIDLINCKFISKIQADNLRKGFSKTGDVLLTHKATLGRTAIVPTLETDYIMLTPQVTYYRVKDKARLCSMFLKYYFDTPFFQETFANHGDSGSTRAYIGITAQHELPILLPPLIEQKAIASVLSSLDDKIDLLHRQNKTLEAMAETLFRQWFIEEAEGDWESLALSEIAIIQNGYAFSSKDYVNYNSNTYEVLKMGHINSDCTLKMNPKKDFVVRRAQLEKYVLKNGDIVMPMTDMKDNVVILGVPALVDKDDKYVLNQRVARIYLKDTKKLSNIYMLFLQLKNHDFICNLQSNANSGVQVNLSTQVIKDSIIFIPPTDKQLKFKDYIQDTYRKINNNRTQIQTLENLRDTLLPKLMSGEVRVKVNDKLH